jgi:hypothetical protein
MNNKNDWKFLNIFREESVILRNCLAFKTSTDFRRCGYVTVTLPLAKTLRLIGLP